MVPPYCSTGRGREWLGVLSTTQSLQNVYRRCRTWRTWPEEISERVQIQRYCCGAKADELPPRCSACTFPTPFSSVWAVGRSVGGDYVEDMMYLSSMVTIEPDVVVGMVDDSFQ